jgi:hypothetical protein
MPSLHVLKRLTHAGIGCAELSGLTGHSSDTTACSRGANRPNQLPWSASTRRKAKSRQCPLSSPCQCQLGCPALKRQALSLVCRARGPQGAIPVPNHLCLRHIVRRKNCERMAGFLNFCFRRTAPRPDSRAPLPAGRTCFGMENFVNFSGANRHLRADSRDSRPRF